MLIFITRKRTKRGKETMNPMSEYKKPLTKEFSLGEHKIVLRSLTYKELEDIEKSITYKLTNFSNSAVYQIKKIEILARSIVTIDGIAMRQFEEITSELAKAENPDLTAIIRKEIESWDSSATDVLYGFYNVLMDEKSKEYKKELDFLSSMQ